MLLSYHYLGSKDLSYLAQVMNHGVTWILDSGGFTAFTKGKEIDLQEYINWLHRTTKSSAAPWKYFALDAIGDPVKTMSRYEEMRKQGLNPIPIFTRGGTREELEHYFASSDVVALGGLVATKGNKAYINGIMKWVGNRKVHLLGFTPHKFLVRYKPYMVDSSTWHTTQKFGNLILYAGNGRLLTIRQPQVNEKTKVWLEPILREFGSSVRELRNPKNWRGGRSIAAMITKTSFVKYTMDLKQQLDVRYFISVGSVSQVKEFFEIYETIKTKCVVVL
jgi:hypothetical protein